MADPYKPPSAPLDAPDANVLPGSVRCPKCGETSSSKVGWTFWGGALGPAMFNAVRCGNCRTQYNGKTGMPLTKAIILYQVVGLALVGVLAAVYFALKR